MVSTYFCGSSFFITAVKLLTEYAGAEISAGFLFRALGMLMTILSFEGDNTSDLTKIKRESKTVVETIAKGQYSKLPKYIEYYGYGGGKIKDEIIYRYINRPELNSVSICPRRISAIST